MPGRPPRYVLLHCPHQAHPKISHVQTDFQIEVVHLTGPASPIPRQNSSDIKREVGAKEIDRPLVSMVLFGDDYADFKGDLAQPSLQRAGVFHEGPVCSVYSHSGVAPVPQNWFPVAGLPAIQSPVGFESGR